MNMNLSILVEISSGIAINVCLKHIQNAFMYETVTSWLDIYEQLYELMYHEQIIWNNSSIRIANCAVFWNYWYDMLWKVWHALRMDILSTSGDFLTCLQFKEKYDFNINVWNYISLVYAIPQKLKKHVMVNKVKTEDSFQDEFVLRILETKMYVNWYLNYVIYL